MSPNVNMGDYLFVKKYAYNNQLPERGDVIVFRTPQLKTVSYIKRLIGLPGDKIQIRDGILYINDVPAPQNKIKDFTFGSKTPIIINITLNKPADLFFHKMSGWQVDQWLFPAHKYQRCFRGSYTPGLQ